MLIVLKIFAVSENRKGSDNKPISNEVWKELLETITEPNSTPKLYVMDAYLGANEK